MTAGHHEIWLFRHGETAWSADGRHTGRADIPLTVDGRQRARAIGQRLARRSFALVLCSPLARAVETCELAGYGDVARLTGNLEEWDYGSYEGLRTPEIQEERPGWSLWRDGVPEGETIAEVGDRAREAIARAVSVDGDVALFAHGHLLRILTACWLGLPPEDGRLLALGTASVSVLGFEHDTRVILKWNQDSHLVDLRPR